MLAADRTVENKNPGLEALKAKGAAITSTEMALFEMLRVAMGPEFKRILNIVK